MFNDPVFQSFVAERPIAVMAQMAIGRLLHSHTVDKTFAMTSEQQYERTMLFSSLTKLMSEVVLGKQPSVNAAYKKLKDDVGVSLNAVYNKLDRVEPRISQALVRHFYQQVLEIRKGLGGNRQNEVPGYRTRIFDGNHFPRLSTGSRKHETSRPHHCPANASLCSIRDSRRLSTFFRSKMDMLKNVRRWMNFSRPSNETTCGWATAISAH